MSKNISILSTKKITAQHLQSLTNISIDGYDFIESTEHQNLNVTFPIDNAIFTSKNAVKSILKKIPKEEIIINNCYCVGKKTALLLEKEGFSVVEYKDNATELAYAISNYSIDSIYFFCGNLRRNELFEILEEKNIQIIEKEVYRTTLTPKKIEKKYQGILFFSPSGIRSYLSKNTETNSIAFCIGTTTASYAINYFETVFAAEEPTIESLINFVNTYYNE